MVCQGCSVLALNTTVFARVPKQQHTCSLESPEFKDALLVGRAKKGTECIPEEHMIISRALKHEKAQAHASWPTPFVIPSGIVKELTSMMQTWLMNEAACPPAVRQEPDNTLNLLDVDFWLWYWKVTPKGMACAFRIRFWEAFSAVRIDSLGIGAHDLDSRDTCERIVWLAKWSEPAYTWVGDIE